MVAPLACVLLYFLMESAKYAHGGIVFFKKGQDGAIL
jgi:hypothetical protein